VSVVSRAGIGVLTVRRYGSRQIGYRAMYVQIGFTQWYALLTGRSSKSYIRMLSAKSGISQGLGLPAIREILQIRRDHNSLYVTACRP
jgi:hypothetical protein